MSEDPESRFARGVGAAPPGPGPGPRPTRTEAAAALYVLAAKKVGSLRSATTPTKGDRRLISLPVEQQLLELKPNGSKMATLATRPRRAAGRVVLGWSIPRRSRCRCAARPSRGGERAVVWRVPYPTGGPPFPVLRNTAHAKPKASRSQSANFLFNLCGPCSCGDRRVDFCI